MPPHMYPRKQRSGKVYLYMYAKGEGGKRKEMPLGDDFILALKKYVELNVISAPLAGATFSDVQKRYLVDEVPKLAANTSQMYKSDIKHLLASFAAAPPALRSQFEKAREAASKAAPMQAEVIKNFRFYDLRAKAADDTADGRGEETARDLLGHESVKTTQRHYLRRGKIVTPTK